MISRKLKKSQKNFQIFRMMTNLQIDFFNVPTFSRTFCDLTLMQQAQAFSLSQMTTLEVVWAEKYYVITKKLRQKSWIYGENFFFEIPEHVYLIIFGAY